jgi:eukaryotic-like serine/threonine-protein kinase
LKTSIVPSVWMIFLCSLLFVPFANAGSSIFSPDISDSVKETNNPTLTPTELWNFTAANATTNTIRISWMKSPVVVNGVVYIVEEETYTIPGESYHDHFGFGPPQHRLGSIYALNALSGIKLWNFTFHSTVGSPTVVDGVVYVSSGGNLYALDAESGAQIWMYIGGGDILWSSNVFDGMIYIGVHGSDYNVYVCALKVTNGEEIWKYNTGWGASVSYPAVDDGVVYFGVFSVSNNYYAVNSTNGDKLWSFTIDSRVQGSSVVDGVVYFASYNNLYALNAKNGEKLWNYDADFTPTSSPIIVGGIVYVSGDRYVYAFDASNGNKLWNYTAIGSYLSPLTISDGVVYFRSAYTFYALKATNGAQLWTSNISAIGSTAISNGVVYINSGNTLLALNTANGNSLWSYTTNSKQSSLLTLVNDAAYFGADSTIFALSVPVDSYITDLSPSPNPTTATNSPQETGSFPAGTVATVSLVGVAIVGAGLLVYFRRKREKS